MVEDRLIKALDEKYHHVYSRDHDVIELLASGFTQAEVAEVYGVNQSSISRIIKKVQTKRIKRPRKCVM